MRAFVNLRPVEEATVDSIGEDGLIELFAIEAGSLGGKVIVPNGDDAAAYFVEPKYVTVVTTDSQVEGVHFDLAYTPPNVVGRKLVSVNVSDIAAMGATSRYALLAVSIPPSTTVETAKRIALGIRDVCKANGVAIIGGNTTTIDGPMVLTITLIGRAEPSHLVRRRGTLVGDAIYVTGHLGDARAGLEIAQAGPAPDHGDPRYPLFSALIDPVVRPRAGRKLGETQLAHAMCDVSDGFSRDLRRLLEPEGLGARIEGSAIPISEALASYADATHRDPIPIALAGGEDYELLFTADPNAEEQIAQLCANAGTPVARVGVVTARPDIEVRLPSGEVVELPTGFEHYRPDG